MGKTRKKMKRAAGKPAKRPGPRKGKVRFITQAEARRRAGRHVLKRLLRGATVRDGQAARWDVYDPTGKLARKEVWLVYPNPEMPTAELRSSKVILVCKRTGQVLYEGSAHDEG